MREKWVEISVGVFVIFACCALLFLALQVSGLTGYAYHKTYTISADFSEIGDLKIRAPVTISGVKIGEISAIKLDPTTFHAIVTLVIDRRFDHIPVDSTANIFTAGLLGSNYISLSPGYATDNLKNGDRLTNTTPALILQNLIGRLMFNLNIKNNNK